MAKRQLSAIMFTDLAGYTAMMQENEINAKGIRDKHRAILEEEISNHQGEILQYYGDGALSIFSSTISASNSAISIQKASIAHQIPLRIGIHTGDVVIEDDGVYGDGVNIASRIESFSVPGSVMVSDKVFDDIKNHQEFSPRLMGEFELKNVKRPVEVYALTNEGLIVPQRTDLKGKVKERIKSIAVLPFVNRSSDPENEYFSDGITEEIITALAKIDDIRVISRASSFSFKGKNLDVREIGKQLEVQSILDGSVRKSGNRVRIVAQLSSTFDGYQLWTETYDRLLEDIFEVQDELSLKIAQQLKEKLATSKVEPAEKTKKISVEAYNHYLKGLYYYNKWTPAYSRKAIESFQLAIALEPAYDQAFAGLALAYSLLVTTGNMNSDEGYRLLYEAAEKALKINPNNESACIAVGYMYFFHDWDFENGYKSALHALEINPKSPEANLCMSLHYIIQGNQQKSIEYIEKAREIDPLSSIANRTLADAYYLAEEYTMAIELYDWLLEKDPEFIAAREFKAWSYLMAGEHDKAIEIFLSNQEEGAHNMQPFVQLGYAYALKGEKAKALEYLEKLKSEASKNPQKSYSMDFATLYTGLGMEEDAFEYMHKFVDERIGAATMIHISPIWKPLREKKEFDKLLLKVGLKKP